MSFIRLITATTLAAACTLGFAQGAASPAKKELVQKVLQLQQPSFDLLARGLAEQSIAQLGQQVGAVLQNRVPPEQREATARDLQAEFKKYGDEVVPLLRDRATKLAPSAVGPVLEEKLSEDELKQLVAMLEAPIYRKYQGMGNDMQKALMDKLVTDTRSTVEPKLKALQESVAKRLGLEAPAAAASGAKKPAASGPTKAAASAAKK
ncbi:MAG: hypothetical protein IPP87_23920 [Ideonella sp.]|jgi:uncharacterized protein|nr:hypothetical protein [Ideonella sp.]